MQLYPKGENYYIERKYAECKCFFVLEVTECSVLYTMKFYVQLNFIDIVLCDLIRGMEMSGSKFFFFFSVRVLFPAVAVMSCPCRFVTLETEKYINGLFCCK